MPIRARGKNGNRRAKGKTFLLAAACASLTPSVSAFTVEPVRGPASFARKSSPRITTKIDSSDPSSSPDDETYFFTAPPEQSTEDVKEVEMESKTMTPVDSEIKSQEQAELENMEVSAKEDSAVDDSLIDDYDVNGVKDEFDGEEDLLSTTGAVTAAAAAAAAAASSSTPAFMDVDGNGTGALMKRSPTAGGVDATLMATNPFLAFPIDSGKEGMQAHDTRTRTRTPANDGIVNQAQPRTRLVRYSLPCTDTALLETNNDQSKLKKLMLTPSKPNTNSQLAKVPTQRPQSSGPRLVRYNGPDVENSTDYDGMELSSVKRDRDQEIKMKRANLVRYKGASQQRRVTEEAPNSKNVNGDENSHFEGRKTLVDDLGYANRYTGLSDFNLAKKTGLTVNKPISLWVERDKFL